MSFAFFPKNRDEFDRPPDVCQWDYQSRASVAIQATSDTIHCDVEIRDVVPFTISLPLAASRSWFEWLHVGKNWISICWPNAKDESYLRNIVTLNKIDQ